MRRRLLPSLLGLAVLVGVSCGETNYVVLSIEDPLNLAASAVALRLTEGTSTIHTFPRNGLPYPITLTLTSDATPRRDFIVYAMTDDHGGPGCLVSVDFGQDNHGVLTCSLVPDCTPAACNPPADDDPDHPPPPLTCTLDADCAPPPVCSATTACSPQFCDLSTCLAQTPRLLAVSPVSRTFDASVPITQTVTGVGFTSEPVVNVAGAPQERVVSSDASITFSIAANTLTYPGYFPITVMNTRSDGQATGGEASNTAWMLLMASSGFMVEDVNPDYGVPDDVVKVYGVNLGDSLIIADGGFHTASCAMSITGYWPGPYANSYVPCQLGAGWSTDGIIAISGDDVMFGRRFTFGANLTQEVGTTTSASTEYSGYPASAVADGDLSTSWFANFETCSAAGRCAWAEVTLAEATPVRRVAIRGNRQFADSYDILLGEVALYPAGGGTPIVKTIFTDRPHADADVDITGDNIVQVRFTSLLAETASPGLAEIEVFGEREEF